MCASAAQAEYQEDTSPRSLSNHSDSSRSEGTVENYGQFYDGMSQQPPHDDRATGNEEEEVQGNSFCPSNSSGLEDSPIKRTFSGEKEQMVILGIGRANDGRMMDIGVSEICEEDCEETSRELELEKKAMIGQVEELEGTVLSIVNYSHQLQSDQQLTNSHCNSLISKQQEVILQLRDRLTKAMKKLNQMKVKSKQQQTPPQPLKQVQKSPIRSENNVDVLDSEFNKVYESYFELQKIHNEAQEKHSADLKNYKRKHKEDVEVINKQSKQIQELLAEMNEPVRDREHNYNGSLFDSAEAEAEQRNDNNQRLIQQVIEQSERISWLERQLSDKDCEINELTSANGLEEYCKGSVDEYRNTEVFAEEQEQESIKALSGEQRAQTIVQTNLQKIADDLFGMVNSIDETLSEYCLVKQQFDDIISEEFFRFISFADKAFGGSVRMQLQQRLKGEEDQIAEMLRSIQRSSLDQMRQEEENHIEGANEGLLRGEEDDAWWQLAKQELEEHISHLEQRVIQLESERLEMIDRFAEEVEKLSDEAREEREKSELENSQIINSLLEEKATLEREIEYIKRELAAIVQEKPTASKPIKNELSSEVKVELQDNYKELLSNDKKRCDCILQTAQEESQRLNEGMKKLIDRMDSLSDEKLQLLKEKDIMSEGLTQLATEKQTLSAMVEQLQRDTSSNKLRLAHSVDDLLVKSNEEKESLVCQIEELKGEAKQEKEELISKINALLKEVDDLTVEINRQADQSKALIADKEQQVAANIFDREVQEKQNVKLVHEQQALAKDNERLQQTLLENDNAKHFILNRMEDSIKEKDRAVEELQLLKDSLDKASTATKIAEEYKQRAQKFEEQIQSLVQQKEVITKERDESVSERFFLISSFNTEKDRFIVKLRSVEADLDREKKQTLKLKGEADHSSVEREAFIQKVAIEITRIQAENKELSEKLRQATETCQELQRGITAASPVKGPTVEMIEKLNGNILASRNKLCGSIFENISYFMRELHQGIQEIKDENKTPLIASYSIALNSLQKHTAETNQESESLILSIIGEKASVNTVYSLVQLYDIIATHFKPMIVVLLDLQAVLVKHCLARRAQ